MRKEISKRITNIRNNLGMNKNEFAKFLGVTPQYIGTIESGENCLSVEKIILLSQKAHVTTDYILLGKTNDINDNLLKSLKNVTEKELDSYMHVVKQILLLLKKDL